MGHEITQELESGEIGQHNHSADCDVRGDRADVARIVPDPAKMAILSARFFNGAIRTPRKNKGNTQKIMFSARVWAAEKYLIPPMLVVGVN